MRGFSSSSSIPGDRRVRQRFSIRLPLEFTSPSQSGTGEVKDISHDGISFMTPDPLRLGEEVNVTVKLPLDRAIGPMELILQGQVVRASGNAAAARISVRKFQPAKAAGVMTAGFGAL
jgi:hypothetical protein